MAPLEADLEFLKDETLVVGILRFGRFLGKKLLEVLGLFPEVEQLVVAQRLELFFEGKAVGKSKIMSHSGRVLLRQVA